MAQPRLFLLSDQQARQRAAAWLLNDAPDGWQLLCTPPPMGDNQRARFNAICGDIARSGFVWAGCARPQPDWRVLLISGHKVATGGEAEVITGLEGELIDVRESTTSMPRERGASLISFATAWAVGHGVRLRDTRYER